MTDGGYTAEQAWRLQRPQVNPPTKAQHELREAVRRDVEKLLKEIEKE